jgi:gamma-butyrobetaine dioxygenase
MEEIIALFEQGGEAAYFGEAVSQKEHALQAAALAEMDDAPDSLVVAALLHDIGHLIGHLKSGFAENIAEQGIDARHEMDGERWLAQHFGPEITEPVRLHVAAKRYLCTVSPEYRSQLSPASLQSLALQGGPMDAKETYAFEQNPFYRDALRLRCWDDMAKVPGLEVPGMEHYRDRLAAAVRRE